MGILGTMKFLVIWVVVSLAVCIFFARLFKTKPGDGRDDADS